MRQALFLIPIPQTRKSRFRNVISSRPKNIARYEAEIQIHSHSTSKPIFSPCKLHQQPHCPVPLILWSPILLLKTHTGIKTPRMPSFGHLLPSAVEAVRPIHSTVTHVCMGWTWVELWTWTRGNATYDTGDGGHSHSPSLVHFSHGNICVACFDTFYLPCGKNGARQAENLSFDVENLSCVASSERVKCLPGVPAFTVSWIMLSKAKAPWTTANPRRILMTV